MGLYRLACTYSNRENVFFLDTLFVDFHRFADESRNSFAVFVEFDGNFRIVLNHGFNAETVRKSVSSRDFWDGTVSDSGWHILHGDSLTGFYQLFSRHDSDFKTLCIKKSSVSALPFIFITTEPCNETDSEKKLVRLLPFIEQTYSITAGLRLKAAKDFVAEDVFTQERNPHLYFLRLNKLFEALFAYLYPSDFNFICDCLCSALKTKLKRGISGISDEKTLIYAGTTDGAAEDLYRDIQKIIQKLFSPRYTSLIRIEKVDVKPGSPSWTHVLKEYDIS
ncbi:hypothetical protein H0R92_10465 [Treponema sp. OMZ 840]|uniref:hypothetical protein n=1 Tax=Treponema sp. OMZ 840 TaxID=244313 RepID=UPI003D8CCE1C